MVRAPALQAGSPRFEPATAHHPSTTYSSVRPKVSVNRRRVRRARARARLGQPHFVRHVCRKGCTLHDGGADTLGATRWRLLQEPEELDQGGLVVTIEDPPGWVLSKVCGANGARELSRLPSEPLSRARLGSTFESIGLHGCDGMRRAKSPNKATKRNSLWSGYHCWP